MKKRTPRRVPKIPKRRGEGAIPRALRQRAIATISERSAVKGLIDGFNGSVYEFLSSEIPYLFTGKFGLQVDGYSVGVGKENGTYNINTRTMNIEKVTTTGTPDISSSEFVEKIISLNKCIDIGVGLKIPLSHIFMFKFSGIFTPAEWGVKMPSNLQRGLTEILGTTPDVPLSLKPNMIHLFIFINRMPVLLECLKASTASEIAGILRASMPETINVVKEVRDLAIETQPRRVFDAPMSSFKDHESLKPLYCGESGSSPCEKEGAYTDQLASQIFALKKIIDGLNRLTANLGYIFLLNYWMYRVLYMTHLRTRLPVSRLQQLNTLRTMLVEPDTSDDNLAAVGHLLTLVENIRLIESPGEYISDGKKTLYPNCVENSIFKMIQIMMFDPESGKYDTGRWRSIDPKLKTFMENLTPAQGSEWNNLVCDRPSVKYNSRGYNIKSKVDNVLTLLNGLSGNTTYASLSEWLDGVYVGKGRVMDDIIRIGDAQVSISEGHTSFIYGRSGTPMPLEINDKLVRYLSVTKLQSRFITLSRFDHNLTYEQFISLIPPASVQPVLYNDDMLQGEEVGPLVKKGILKVRYAKDDINIFLYNLKAYRISLAPGDIPNDVKTITYYSSSLTPGILPPGLETLEFDELFDQPLTPGLLPANLKVLTFGYLYNQPLVPGALPANLEELTFGVQFDKSLVPGALPANLKNLFLGDSFNQPLVPGALPANLKNLFLGDSFNQPLTPGVLPANIKVLGFGLKFNQPLAPGVLPTNLEELRFVTNFDQPLTPGLLPANLKVLVFGLAFNQPLTPGALPENLEELTFGIQFNQPLTPGSLPVNLKVLTFGLAFNQPLTPGALPANLKELTFGVQFNKPLTPGALPENLEELSFGVQFNQPLTPGVLPANLKNLFLGDSFNRSLVPGALPANLKRLTFGERFNQPLTRGALPTNLEELTFGYLYNQPLVPGALPANLKRLTFSWTYMQPIVRGVLPHGLENLFIPEKLIDHMSPDALPSGVKVVRN